ncbi:hypothetical protein O1611_g7364 [Lasiodiplodia mahajangana]|uniref:Uncharacterized protein n=1 Tax=Lasiodiplodia mahajangana TaxID=1108764 RepID=A0ACC2JFH9_9PEZI|nr:hypothetical protein O1611_g7364 [Lasiodiplodia mahajangana]
MYLTPTPAEIQDLQLGKPNQRIDQDGNAVNLTALPDPAIAIAYVPQNHLLPPQLAQPSMGKVQYRYQPLQDNNTIRILTLSPGHRDDLLTGTLEVVPINFSGSYEALSYVWADPGPPNCAYSILVNGGEEGGGLLVLRGGSVYAALCQLRLPDRKRRIWADQCCINQDDPIERSQQLQFMNRIYQDATHVLVWLGLDTNNEAVPAFHLVRGLDAALRSHPTDAISHDPDAVKLERYISEHQEVLKALTDRSWFKRGWIVQEIGTSTPASIIWGNAEIEWDTLAGVCERLKCHHHLRNRLGIATSDISFLFRRFVEPDKNTYHANRFNFVYELQRARHLQFSDDRDRVFAFLGHFSVRSLQPLGCGPVSIRADYTKTVEQTYIDVAIQILQANPAAAFIVLAAVQQPPRKLPSRREETGDEGLHLEAWFRDEGRMPSWVPDWRRFEAIILAEPICPHRAHGDSTAKLAILEEEDLLLRIHGVKIDIVEACSQPLSSHDFYGKKTPDQEPTIIEQLWHNICGKGCFNLNDKYLNGETAFFAFMQALSNGCVQAAGHECQPYHEIADDVWLRRAARYIVETVKGPDKVSEEIREVAGGAERESDREKWVRWAASASEGRLFARTEMGYYVLGPVALEVGDIVCVLFGGKVPFCLRPIGARYFLVGECYVHGLMKGEAMGMFTRDEVHEKTFDIV